MANVTLKNIFKSYNHDLVVEDVNLEIFDKEFIILVGPSGCGKSTTLRMIAGLEEISSGEIYIDGKLVNDISPKDRDISMVFQNYALYPHMTVYDNMSFGLKLRKYSKSDIEKKVNHAAQILGLSEYLKRKPKELSGGQRQRVALGRAIVREPKVFLFDEPLSNLDAKLRVQMRAEISKLHKSLQATIIYVTHDQIEAMTMADRIVVMNNGKIQQIDTPLNLYYKPKNLFVASFIGSPSMNFIDGNFTEEGKFISTLKNFQVLLPEKNNINQYINKNIVMGIRPEDILINSILTDNQLYANVEIVEPMGSETYIYFKVENTMWLSKISSEFIPKLNSEIRINFKPDRIHFFDKESGNLIGGYK